MYLSTCIFQLAQICISFWNILKSIHLFRAKNREDMGKNINKKKSSFHSKMSSKNKF